ncbi:MAG: LytTR family transcriptional regulator DNA-binding domain-containing protein [Lachnospiraceae bacterium]|nr:LytTR family transcriptional regulator DNA-binding domain-containing protein [Lachnospiraceae bacterium]
MKKGVKILICSGSIEESQYTKSIIEKQKLAAGAELVVRSALQFVSEINGRVFEYDIALVALKNEGLNNPGVSINRIAPGCVLIYIASLEEYTPDIYETTHCYLVLKDQQEEYLKRALEKAYSIAGSSRYIKITRDYERMNIKIQSIRYITRVNRKVRVVSDSVYDVNKSLRLMLEELPEAFVRCHEGYVVNLEYVEKTEGRNLILKSGEAVPLGRAYKESFHAAFLSHTQKIRGRAH